MKISDIDKNLKVETSLPVTDLRWLTPLDVPLSLHGVYDVDKDFGYIRLPVDVARATSDGVFWLFRNTAGVRVRFRTDSPYIAMKLVSSSDDVMSHITALGQCGVDLYKTDNKISTYVQSYMPYYGRNHGYASIAYTDGKMHTYTMNLPLYNDVKEFYVGFAPDATIEAAEPYTIEQPVLYYGSSITQGGCASRPGNAYQAMISRRFDCDFLNLGFSGAARGEQSMVNYIASLNPSIFVLDYDHNAPNPAHLRQTHEPLFQAFRAAHPTTPVIFVSKPDFKPGTEDEERRAIVRATYDHAVAGGDRAVWYIDGETLFNGSMRDSCTVDGCHPNDLGFYRMADRIGGVMAEIWNTHGNW